jgi:hypothetical protein
MPRPLRPTAAILATLLVFAAGVAPAAAQSGGADAGQRIVAAVDRTTGAGTANVMMSIDIAAEDESVYIRADGGFDFDLNRGLMITDFSGAPPFQPGAKIEYRFVGDIVYADFAQIAEVVQELPNGKHWVRIDTRQLEGDLASSGRGAQQKPTSVLATLRGVSKKAEVVGVEEVRGAPATHYRATTDPKKVLERLPKNSRKRVGKIQRQLYGDRPLPIGVWIDDQGRVVRAQLQLNLANLPNAKAAGKTGTERVTSEYFEFGAPLYVYPPPKSETVDSKNAFPNKRGTPVYS